ncbi:zinc-dependent alcohol dehydrogenase [Ruania alba]|uniref:2-desacetyl-2-hydroxyethyl bacteriochlorophyllide A dehydrogenase n=1 Tax=Ruania alba TaxID=648782 RepID=A0A1H5M6B3_9MICO|nr:zinc-binding alcohol dehydrogenase [Ruania alba]SEE84780.1 2-desacetyl-2-hydroxyethyl bacteriochlorophyllide A dehydrogenase [Ruania alba]
MGRIVRFSAPQHAEVVDVDDPALAPDEVRLRTLWSGISAGTELTAYRGTNPYMHHRWDTEDRLFVTGEPTHTYPLDGWGYEEVGRISEVGSDVDAGLVGRLVWGTWGHRTSAVRSADWVAPRLMEEWTGEEIDERAGAFAKIGAIALNAVLDADIHVGETVAVFGAGVPGQLTAQLARLNGGRVIVLDPIASRRELAEQLGAVATINPTEGAVAEQVRALTDGRGADVAIEMSGHYQALHEAVRTVAYSSRVVASGFFQGGATPVRLGEEFHHNRVAVICSQISGVAPALQHRWDEIRESTTVLQLAREGALALDPLISHVLPAEQAPQAFEMLDRAPQDALQVLLDYRDGA